MLRLMDGHGLRGDRQDVYLNGVRVGWIEWQPDRVRPGWYFEAEDFTLGVEEDGGVFLWFLSPYENGKGHAIKKFRKRFCAAFGNL